MAIPKRFDEMAWANIRKIRSNRDAAFVRDILQARSDFLRLRMRHIPAIRKIYVDAADQIAKRLRDLPPTTGKLTRDHLAAIEKELRKEADKIAQKSEPLIKRGIKEAFGLGTRPTDNQLMRAVQLAGIKAIDIAKLQRGFADINTSAVGALWARTKKGLTVSQRIWNHSRNARDEMLNLIQTGLAAGRDAVKVARDLERYVRNGARTLAEDYPNMMARMKKRVPKDLCYEALRLARSEYSNAFFEGTYSRGRVNPSYTGVRWMLSDAHEIYDICDELANADLYNMGPGVYPAGEEPTYAHPQCMCFVVPHLQDTEKFIERLIKWQEDPKSDKDLNEWYNKIYKKM